MNAITDNVTLPQTGRPAQSLNIFISYAHEDMEIAEALKQMLNRTFGSSLSKIFLDTQSIPLGGEISDEVKAGLSSADVLLILSTGALRGSHSWGGFELGYFEACRNHKYSDSSIRGRVVTICWGDAVPAPIKNRKYIRLQIDDNLVDRDEAELEKSIRIQENDPFVMLLAGVLQETTGESLADRRDLRDLYEQKVKTFLKTVYKVFKNRVRDVRKPQKQLLIRYSSKQVDPMKEEIPADAVITSIGNALEVFGIADNDSVLQKVEAKEVPIFDARGAGTVSARKITWRDFRERVARNELAAHWCNTLSRITVPSGSQNVNVDNSQVVVSNELRRYRLLLTTGTTFYDGNVETSIYLVETLQRKDYGREDTTLLMKGLHIVCRFRFLFLEPSSEFHAINVKEWKVGEVPEKARQLLGELDFILTEARHAQLDKPGAWAQFVPLKQLETMGETWRPIETELRKLCLAAIDKAGQETEITKIIAELKAQLDVLLRDVTPHNASLLRAMSTKLAELAGT